MVGIGGVGIVFGGIGFLVVTNFPNNIFFFVEEKRKSFFFFFFFFSNFLGSFLIQNYVFFSLKFLFEGE